MTDLFVCGTDTGCGKTVVTAALALHLGATDTTVVKPVQTGCPPDDDAAWISAVTGASSVVFERFHEPLAPAVCAERARRPLSVPDLADRTRSVRATHRICEAAGGLLAPLAGADTMADLARDLAWPVVIATRPSLGTLNHTALTIEACRHRGLEVAGTVVSGYAGGVVEETNLDRLRRMAPLLGVVTLCDDWSRLADHVSLHQITGRSA